MPYSRLPKGHVCEGPPVHHSTDDLMRCTFLSAGGHNPNRDPAAWVGVVGVRGPLDENTPLVLLLLTRQSRRPHAWAKASLVPRYLNKETMEAKSRKTTCGARAVRGGGARQEGEVVTLKRTLDMSCA